MLIAGLLCSNVVVLGLSAYSLVQSRQQYQLRAEALTQNTANALDQSVSGSIEKIELALRTVGDELQRQLAAGKGIDELAMNAFLLRQERRLPEVEAFRVANADGRVILGKGVSKREVASWADRDYFIYLRQHADPAVQISKPRMGRVAKQYIVGFALRYNYPDGRFAGVVSAPISLDHFTRLLSRYDVGAQGAISLRDTELGLITRAPLILDQPAGQIGNTLVSPEFRRLVESGVPADTFHTPASGDGFDRFVTFRRLARAPMYAIVGVASAEALADWYDEVYKTSFMAGGFLLLSLILGGVLLRQLARNDSKQRLLAEREAQLSSLVEAVPDAIIFKDGGGRWLVANNVCLRIFGLADKPWQGRTDAELGISALNACQRSDEEAWASGSPLQRSEEWLDYVDGRRIDIDVTKVPLFDGEGRRQAMLVVGRDISERKRNEAELEQHRRHLEELVAQRTAALLETEAKATHILNSSAAGLYGIDDAGCITFINSAACATLGYEPADVIGQSAHTLFHHHRPDGSPYPAEACPSYSALHLGQKIRVDNEVYWHADGHAVPVIYATHPMFLNDRVSGAVTSFVDVSEQRAATQAREKALAAAENLARVRSEFLANMSHEIRTPLHGVLGFAQIGFRNFDNSEKAREAFAKILASGQRLLGVINDVLDFSKIEAGKLGIEQATVTLSEVLGHAVELVRDRAEAKGIDLRLEVADDFPRYCVSDPLRMGQVLLNLLSNAVKFTESGSVRLTASLDADELVFRVIDTGIGMNNEQLAELFTPFQQADASASRRFGGTGLGLAISKRILELMNGSVSVHSQLAIGTTVEVRLPYVASSFVAPSLPLPALTDETKPLAGLSFLIAEDDLINRMVIEDNLLEDGARVVMAVNGREAVERIVQDGRDAYDIVLMDIQMPEMDGYEATRRILELAPDLPIIAQTAHAFNEERDKCLAAGMVDHVAKPIRIEDLIRVVRQYVQPK
ncbi:hypothetical protein AT959_18040 [Dechloromonas denitrificans]|uniref:Virulence sensor protein BvgS n=1 Tax=Dechloromonas denitrificans TaxID=281362 RepID=A0A133XFT4_9RHOO|nr:hypothetical protein AT959_18040 [Dechloromonas denitrificans]